MATPKKKPAPKKPAASRGKSESAPSRDKRVKPPAATAKRTARAREMERAIPRKPASAAKAPTGKPMAKPAVANPGPAKPAALKSAVAKAAGAGAAKPAAKPADNPRSVDSKPVAVAKAGAGKSAAPKAPAGKVVAAKAPPAKLPAARAPEGKQTAPKGPEKKSEAASNLRGLREGTGRPPREAVIAPPAPAPIRGADPGLSDKDLEMFRALLLEKRNEILGNMNAMREETGGGGSDRSELSSMPIHMADLGTDHFERELTLTLLDGERSLLRDIDSALDRIRDGTYGLCLATGKPIGKARLKAQPWAKYCMEYMQQQESRRRFRY